MKPTEAELEKELEKLNQQRKVLAQANEDLWKAIFVENSTSSRAEGFPQIARNYDELKTLAKHGSDVVAELVRLESERI